MSPGCATDLARAFVQILRQLLSDADRQSIISGKPLAADCCFTASRCDLAPLSPKIRKL